MISKRLLGINRTASAPAPAATDPYYAYRSLILNFDGNFNDSSPNALTVTPYGNAQIVSDATFGSVASFDGAGDYLSNTSNDVFKFGTGDFTVEYWFKVNALPGTYYYHQIAGKSNTSSEMSFGIGSPSPGKVTLSATTSTVGRNGTTNLTVGNWYYATFVRLSGTLYIYLNGVLDATHTNATTDLTPTSFAIGGNYGSSYFFNGLLGPLRISPWAAYTSNFTPSQELFPVVQQLPVQDPWYNKTSLILNMDGTPTSQIFVDDSPNALAVTAVGDAQIVSDATFGTVASFDGVGDYLTLAGSGGQFAFGTSPFTIEFWLYPLDITTRQGLYSNNINSSSGIGSGPVFAIRGLGQTGKLGVGNVGQADKVETGQNVLLLNTWQHIALIREGTGTNQTKIYIDGVLQGQGTMSDNYSVSRDAALGRTIYYSEYLNGKIGPTRITKGLARDPADFLLSPPSKFPTLYNPYTELPVAGAALWLDAADDSTLYTDAGATQVVKSGDQVYQWNDKSGNNRHAIQTTSANRPTWLPPASGRNGLGALAFNGTSQLLNLSSNPIGTNDFTIEFWMKQNATTNSYWVILDSRISGNALGYPVILYNNSATSLSFYNNGWLLTATVPTLTWTHIAFTRSGGTLRMFVNGVQQASATDTSSYATFRQLGKAFDPYYFNGQIQNLIIYNGQALYTSNFTPWMS